MKGELFLYDDERGLSAFESEVGAERRGRVIFIGGLTDGFLTSPYIEPLSKALAVHNLSLVQFVMSSSYRQFGLVPLHQDALDLARLIDVLAERDGKKKLKVFLLGHSTGCQDIFEFLKTAIKSDHPVYGANVHAPLSDRDYFQWAMPEWTEKAIKAATELIASGREDWCLNETIGGVPLMASRALSLLSRLGEDDYFSADLTAEECKEKFPCDPFKQHPTFRSFGFSYSLDDEYSPDTALQPRARNIEAMISKLTQVYPFNRQPILLPGNHNLSNRPDSIVRFCEALVAEVLEAFAE